MLLKHPKNITINDLMNYNWDLVELPITLDYDDAMIWFNTVKQNYEDCAYRPGQHKDVIGTDETRDRIFDYLISNVLYGNLLQWSMQWSYERPGIIPSIANGNTVLYPELLDPNFNGSATNLNNYMFGAYKKYHELLGNDCFQATKLLEFQPGDGLKPHVDVDVDKEGKWKFRLVFQLNTSTEVWWKFSNNVSPHLSKMDNFYPETTHEREYRLETGKVYLVNTAVTHSVKNEGNDPWIMIQSDPSDSVLNRLLQIENLHLC